jgi:hypothetical protein
MTTTSPHDTVVVENPSHELMLGVSSYDMEFDLEHFLEIEKKKRFIVMASTINTLYGIIEFINTEHVVYYFVIIAGLVGLSTDLRRLNFIIFIYSILLLTFLYLDVMCILENCKDKISFNISIVVICITHIQLVQICCANHT